MCVAVITCHESDFHLIRATATTKERLKSGSSFFGCFHNSFIVFTARGLCDGVTCLFSLAFPSNRNFGSNVLSSLLFKYSLDLFISSFIMPRFFFDGQFMRSSRKHKNSRWMTSSEFLKLNLGREAPKKMQANSTRVSFSISKNSIVFIIPSPANYLEFSSPSSHNFFPIQFSCKQKKNFLQLRIQATKCNCV